MPTNNNCMCPDCTQKRNDANCNSPCYTPPPSLPCKGEKGSTGCHGLNGVSGTKGDTGIKGT